MYVYNLDVVLSRLSDSALYCISLWYNLEIKFVVKLFAAAFDAAVRILMEVIEWYGTTLDSWPLSERKSDSLSIRLSCSRLLRIRYLIQFYRMWPKIKIRP